MLRDEVTEEGFSIRRITDLSLVRAQHPVFILGWNIMHVIDDGSPLKAESAESLNAAGTVFILSLSGTDVTTGQMLMARNEYSSTAIRWNQSFRDVLDEDDDGALQFDYRKFNEVEPLADTSVDDRRQ
jgi:inward rectifier potassium channel